ncbi:52 kDa repressor of the inhibitor of the protein kinase-like [Myzus persicae]|uniref:52 kDa repressor of the inhibitor of the protein kinase-like n=1 Tax=Myzus persicae TaxID=13164 RepID=UPI000B936F7A|nr:52 kDa repressor of the inhibitor of the protein kinase-like [Myzus persicae]
MSDSLDIDIERLITSVQSRVVLWDKTSEKYKDKFKTLEAWKAVCTEIIDGYEDFDDSKKNDIEAKDIAEKLNIEPKMPRICSSQRNRSNVPSNNIEEYYKKSIFIPYLDDLMMALNERFIPHNETITSLQYVLPTVEFYENDLPGLNDVIEAEYEIWQAKWKNIEDNLRPTTAIEALSVCDNLMYPNMYELIKILAIIPVSTATAERSFSTLRRLKTYLRNTTSESRLVGLALLAIHRDIDIPDDILLDKFANSGKERNLNLI